MMVMKGGGGGGWVLEDPLSLDGWGLYRSREKRGAGGWQRVKLKVNEREKERERERERGWPYVL